MRANLLLTMENLTFDESHPLFEDVLKGVTDIVDTIAYGVKYDSSSVDVQEPNGEWINIPRMDWLMELRPALAFFEHVEYYEECAKVQALINTLEAEPTVESIVKSINDDYSTSHGA